MTSPRSALCILLALCSSCTISMSEGEKIQNILSAPSIEKSEKIAFETPFCTRGQWPEKTWWTQYGLNELNELIEKALEENPTIQAIQEKIKLAEAQAVIARSELFPLIYFDASDTWEHLSENGLYRALNPDLALNNSLIDFSLSFFYEFDFWGKYRNLYKAALSEARSAVAESAQVELIVTTALAQSYFALRTNLIRKALYEELFRVRKSYFELQDKMEKNSLYSKLIPLLSEEDLFQAKQWLYNIEQEISVNQHIVNILAGQGPDEELCLDEPLKPLAKSMALPDNISLDLLVRRPDLMAQINRLDALAFEVGAAKAEFLPNINLSGLVGFQSGSWSKLFEWISKTVSVIPGLSLPVFTAGAIGANVDVKKARFNEAVYEYNDLILKSFQQVTDLLSMGLALYGEKEKQEQIVANATKRYQLTKQRQKSGIDSALVSYKYLEAVIEKKLEDVQLSYQQYVVNIGLIKALGGGYG